MISLRIAQCMLFGALCILIAVPGAAQQQPDIDDIFRNELACLLIEPLLADMQVSPVYEQADGCRSVVPDDDPSAVYYLDESCQIPLAFEPTPLIDHCTILIDSSGLGEGLGIEEPVWTLPPGTRIDVGAKSLTNLTQPYLQRQIYRTVETPAGTCSLEMRVYASQPTADDQFLSAETLPTQPSLLALHGGSWSARGFGFFGLELTIPHFVDQGFVVYAPFYRLLGSSEGSAACRDASIAEIVEDARFALSWVQDHAAEFGSSDKPVVFGQSAGAHLAASLAVNDAQQVAAAVLFYPPTDFTDFALRAQSGIYTNEQGLGILDRVLGVPANQVDINLSPVPENSFPQQILEGDLSVPAMFIMHGMADELVEPRQSVRLCDALAGRELGQTDEPINPVTVLREQIECGVDSQLHLIREGQHALDVCFEDAVVATDLCLSGSDASREQVSLAIADAVSFARSRALGVDSVTPDSMETPTGSSGGALNPLILMLLIGVGFIQLVQRSLTPESRLH
ncbi:MAG: alpha/beta hydrolase [Granulosicoccus sp.]